MRHVFLETTVTVAAVAALLYGSRFMPSNITWLSWPEVL
jgi:hypothetical protein